MNYIYLNVKSFYFTKIIAKPICAYLKDPQGFRQRADLLVHGEDEGGTSLFTNEVLHVAGVVLGDSLCVYI